MIAGHRLSALAEHRMVCTDCHLFCSLRFDFLRVDASSNALSSFVILSSLFRVVTPSHKSISCGPTLLRFVLFTGLEPARELPESD